ncbi:Methyltransferase type 12 [Stanieria cyanosphaera PCC 7437]|uniref:Methyltransferase type 12 n=1 Tax=Stanieria cyanosphaera (strain ATCC 29371 / PCC 7437) TaxID=111780 RepID=K9XXV5_STAC7|nr:class I SAM-dependent methyltransferase [Stanieria cyanosphaera]AFZ36936.1 Methyltransferase type 12 [Stanieria cyanosphaera PCC 7437]
MTENHLNPWFLEFTKENLKQRKSWYSSVAEAYNQVRPGYSQEIIASAIKLAHLNPETTKILEIGCGPGNATVAFAKLGFSMICLEPNQDFCQLARQNCHNYPQVEIINTSLEEWQLIPEKFDAVLAANSWHWLPPEISYDKASQSLKDRGHLILLWNMNPEPSEEISQLLAEVYQQYAPLLFKYEGKENQKYLNIFADHVLNSGKFGELVTQQFPCEANYSIDHYLTLLNTMSPYLNLEPQIKNDLFTGLKEKIINNCGDNLQLFYLSACQVARTI